MNNIVNLICKSSKSILEADFLKNVLGAHYFEVLNGKMLVVLFGAGIEGDYLCTALKIHRINILYIFDSNPEYIGTICAGCPVLSSNDIQDILKTAQSKFLIVVSSLYKGTQKVKELENLGFHLDNILLPANDPLLFYNNRLTQQLWRKEDFEFHSKQMEEIYELFADQKSKDIFIYRHSLFIGAFDYLSYRMFIDEYADLLSPPDNDYFSNPKYDENYFYFNSDFFPLYDSEVFANVGALIGDCAIEFVRTCDSKEVNYREIINFEPDPNNFRQLKLNMESIPNVKCMPFGLWSKSARLRFSNPDPSKPGTVGSIDDSGKFFVDVVSLDELLPDAKISLLKMDVEGAEMEALRGAANTIRRNKPKLAISVYHKRNDLFEIPMFIHQLYPGYKLYLRHHSTTFSETVLFAVP